MSEQSFEELLNEDGIKTVRSGDVVEGTVFDVKPDQIILNIGTKADGILTRDEYSNDSSVDLTTVAKPGDTMEVKVLKVNDSEGQVFVTYKRLAAEKGNKKLEAAFNNGEVLKAKVVRVLTGGLSTGAIDQRESVIAHLTELQGVGKAVVHGAHIGKAASRIADGRLCPRITSEEEQAGVLFVRIGRLLRIGIDVIEDRFAGCGAMPEGVHDLHRRVGVDAVVPGQAETAKGTAAVVILIHGKQKTAVVIKSGIVHHV